jgi:hypothetical protein
MTSTLHTKQNTLATLSSISNGILTNGANGTSYTTAWAQPAQYGSTVLTVNNDPTPSLEVKGKVVINGLDLEERLKTIEKVLMIPERDAIMEAKYPSLKKKHDEYINLLGKYRTFEAIKGDNNGTT